MRVRKLHNFSLTRRRTIEREYKDTMVDVDPGIRWLYIYGQDLPNTAANSGAVLSLCTTLERQGDKVTVAYPNSGGTDHDVRSSYDLSDSMELIKIHSRQDALRYPALAFSALRAAQFDVVLTRMPAVAVISALVGLPTILELHQHLHTFRNWKYWRMFLHAVRKKNLAVAALTESILDGLDPLMAAKSDSTVVIPSASPDFATVDETDFSQMERRFDVGYVGSFLPGKGIERVVELASRSSSISFVVYGDTSLNPEVLGALTRLPNVTIGGFVSRRQVGAALRSFNIGLAPYGNLGFGGGATPFVTMDSMSSLKLAEYMSASCAIISSKIPAVEAMVADGKHALLCDPDNPSEWAHALDRLVTDSSLRRELVSRARARYERRFSFPQRAQQFRALASRFTC